MQHKVSYLSRQSAFTFLLFISSFLFFTVSCKSSTVNNEPIVNEPIVIDSDTTETPLETPAVTEPANPEVSELSQPEEPLRQRVVQQ